ncbi:MAG: exo-alpha-sialidase [Planctomycetes bacterium]|nr:exo-alpha-sialidase [Planctomycetota bacterium]
MRAVALIALLACGVRAQIDLSGDETRRVVVDREAGQYLGHPTTVLLEDGRTILCVYPKGHGKGAICLKRSSDGGRSWSERLPVPETWATSLETPTVHRTVDAGGKRRLVVFSGLFPIRSSISEDDGATWTELAPIGDFGGIVAMASVARLRDGRYAAWFHDDGRFFQKDGKQEKPVRFTLYQVLSDDGGLTWSEPRAIWSGTDLHLCEPGFVRSPDGATIALLLRENRRAQESQVMFSHDQGESWTEPKPLGAALTGDRHVAQYAADGRLVVTLRDMRKDSPTRGDWVVWVGAWQDLVDAGPGAYRARLMDNRHGWDCGYPGLERLPDGSFVATSYGHWVEGEPPFVVSVSFTLAEFDAASPADPKDRGVRERDRRR